MAGARQQTRAEPATADREIVISRVIDAPRELVFEAFTEVRHLSRWWGPEGFTTTTRAFEFRVGGEWDFVMHGPDGTDYQEWISWTEIAPPERIALLHGESRGDPNAFFASVHMIYGLANDGGPTEMPAAEEQRHGEVQDEHERVVDGHGPEHLVALRRAERGRIAGTAREAVEQTGRLGWLDEAAGDPLRPLLEAGPHAPTPGREASDALATVGRMMLGRHDRGSSSVWRPGDHGVHRQEPGHDGDHEHEPEHDRSNRHRIHRSSLRCPADFYDRTRRAIACEASVSRASATAPPSRAASVTQCLR